MMIKSGEAMENEDFTKLQTPYVMTFYSILKHNW